MGDLSPEDMMQYLDEVSANLNASNVILDHDNSGNLSISATTSQAMLVEVLRSTTMSGVGTTLPDKMCDFSAIKVTV